MANHGVDDLAVEVATRPLANPLDPLVPEITRLIARLASKAGNSSRVEYLRSAVGAEAVAQLGYDAAGELVAIDITDDFDLAGVRHLLPRHPGSFGHVQGDGARHIWCSPLGRTDGRLLCVPNPPSWLVELGQVGAKILETVWDADFAKNPVEAEIQVLTALRATFGRLPGPLFDRCLGLYREVIEGLHIVFQPVVKIGEVPRQVGVHSYEALARRSLEAQSAPGPMLQVAHVWGDHFVVERDKIILAKALSAYAAAHAAGPYETPKPIAVNVSVRSLLDDSYIETLRMAVEDSRLDPSCVTLEISEQDAIAPWPGETWLEAPHTYFHNRLARIAREIGVAFAVDDFGVAHASLDRMAELRLTQINVDRAILHHTNALQELDLVVAVARESIGRVVIVEGVDQHSPVTLNQLYKRKIKHVQGWITGQRGAPDLRRLDPEVSRDIAALVRGDDDDRPARLTRDDPPALRRGA